MSASAAPPALLVSANGAGVITDENLNTFVQGGALLANLRAFPGLSRMTVWMIGTTAANDGGQGMFYYNPAAITADDGGLTSIQPFGVIFGRWLRQSGSSVSITAVPTIAALRALTTAATPVWVEGYYAPGDGGEGMFNLGAAHVDNGGTIIVSQNGTYYRETGGLPYSARWFGARGNGVTNDAPAIAAALTALSVAGGGVLAFLLGTYLINSKITLPNGVSLSGQCGAAAFPELNAIAVSKLIWGGATNGTMCDTVPTWAGNISDLVFDGNGIAGTCWAPVGIGGCLISNVSWINSTLVGVSWSTTSGIPSGLNTFLNCKSDDHTNIGFQMSGLSNAPVTLNTFVGCRFSAGVQSLRILQWADTNAFFGGRIEGGTSYGIVINDPSGGLNVDGISFYNVAMDGSSIGGSAFCFIGPSLLSPPAGGGSTVAMFRDCHFDNSSIFNAASGDANIKVVDCPNFAAMFFSTGDYVPAQDISVTASPFTYTHTDPFAATVVVAGGTISLITLIRNGISHVTGLESGSFPVNPGDQVVITYSVTPAACFRYQT